ncbi:class I SAM-dependent methyltransferase [Streptomyces phyllanthi]|uniref:Class I SAM-dependent methyltransferase n=1 Tax=Streptomyces phyllanthi TaxID=1803180 RepID=A0A5N8W7Y4_9ACTN|nr:class I SAM-dependent methyltransferase [Streptomyces phyllanthi]MPY43222.1 class I SAM-dependent methyltransferase [Streptomyces phyllanthi]
MSAAPQPNRPELAPATGPFPAPRPETGSAPRREDCPWCGSRRLRVRIRSHDPARRVPGTFVVDGCRDCGHVFQNPRLTAQAPGVRGRGPRGGHDFLAERLLGARGIRRRHRAAARAMLPYPEPESWLDVGTGHGHFPEAAREVHPYTAFDGLDATPRVERARAAGRVEEAQQGALTDPEIAGRLRGRYDVVSMFHHLEHAPDPRAELRAALDVLRPGGHLVVEVPDPACAFGTLLGKWWVPYDQPRHLHLMPLGNLVRELESHGCTVVATDRRAPHIPYDLTGALWLALTRSRARTALTWAGLPLLASAAALDLGLAPLLRRTRFSNAYRIIARREPARDDG